MQDDDDAFDRGRTLTIVGSMQRSGWRATVPLMGSSKGLLHTRSHHGEDFPVMTDWWYDKVAGSHAGCRGHVGTSLVFCLAPCAAIAAATLLYVPLAGARTSGT